MKQLLGVYQAPTPHWVGDGFPVRTLFSYDRLGKLLSPFLLLDYAGPADFPPSTQRRGVGEHPHRGFETVTLVYSGEVSHRDSAGNGGTIGAGDVQWMTAGSGVMHEEFHSEAFTQRGGPLKMAQLWVNLPARDKMTAPRYQAITNAQIPVVQLAAGAGEMRVVAGRFHDSQGPALTFTELNVWDLRARKGAEGTLPLPAGHNAVIAVLGGRLQTGGRELGDGDTAIFDAGGEGVQWRALEDSTVLVLSGQPIGESIAGYGPFVMNTREEIVAAFEDLQSGRFARLN
ncbi:MAG TPA: pirin family protein [Steroidobacteraceae bacterium]|nr:pirin family protein [Steroidobacteraceae bacterium]